MPSEVKDIKKFLELCHRKDAKAARIKKIPATGTTKFKIRCSRFIYTLSVSDSAKAEKLKQSLPPGLSQSEVPKKNKKGKREA